jgi:hypothetical protein
MRFYDKAEGSGKGSLQPLIFRGHLGVVDNERVDGAFGGLEFQA